MLEQTATVVDVDEQTIWVRAQRQQGGCNSCSSSSTCGVSVVAQLFPGKDPVPLGLPLEKLPDKPHAGDTVIIGIDEIYLQRSSLWLYAMPLLGLIFGAAIGQGLGSRYFSADQAEPLSVLLGLLGLSVALLWNRHRSIHDSKRLRRHARVLRVVKRSVAVAFPQ